MFASQVVASSLWPPAVATMAVGFLALVGVTIGVGQKWRNDARERWWDRTRWALDQLWTDGDRRTVGLLVLSEQMSSKLGTSDDGSMLQAICELVLEEMEPNDD